MLEHGHGHVFPNANGAVARCGGPALCRDCSLEQDIKDLQQQTSTMANLRQENAKLQLAEHAFKTEIILLKDENAKLTKRIQDLDEASRAAD